MTSPTIEFVRAKTILEKCSKAYHQSSAVEESTIWIFCHCLLKLPAQSDLYANNFLSLTEDKEAGQIYDIMNLVFLTYFSFFFLVGILFLPTQVCNTKQAVNYGYPVVSFTF